MAASTHAAPECSHYGTAEGVDEFYFDLLNEMTEHDNMEEEDNSPISDEKYAGEMQLQEVIMSSVLSFLQNQSCPPLQKSPLILKDAVIPTKPETHFKNIEMGESSTRITMRDSRETLLISCKICLDVKRLIEMFENKSCLHVFCTECTIQHIVSKIQENNAMVKCPLPNCKGTLELEFCESILPDEILTRWEELRCESMIPTSQKFFCPFKDCSALLIDDKIEVVRESECPYCCRLFCAQCKVPWHAGFSCDEFCGLSEYEKGMDDLKVIELAKQSSWKRCPRCKYFVEKIDGCLHITCRCGFQFCYACGDAWTETHGGCVRT